MESIISCYVKMTKGKLFKKQTLTYYHIRFSLIAYEKGGKSVWLDPYAAIMEDKSKGIHTHMIFPALHLVSLVA